MKLIATVLLTLAATTVAAPQYQEYPPPPGGWESVDYPEGTGENLPYYPPPPGGWESVDYGSDPHPGDGDGSSDCLIGPIKFTSTYHVRGVPEEVVNGTDPHPTGGLPGCFGFYDIGINSELDIICWNIKLIGFQGAYSSPADTATHIHEGARGRTGPPRVIFPDPVGDGHERYSVGCAKGPFKTGVVTNGADAGDGFTLKEIEENPEGFYADIHSDRAIPGANRGQFA